MTDEVKYNDYPWDEIIPRVSELADKGALCFQKFTCDGCGNRLTIDEPNKFHVTGSCDKCGHVTDIKAKGCNYLLIAPPGSRANEEFLQGTL